MTSQTQINSTANPRDRIIDALMALAGERAFEDISITDIARQAGVSLADFRDCFPSKGAVLGGFSRRMDHAVLMAPADDLDGEAAKERLFDVLMRRLDAMAPYKGGIAGVLEWARREPMEAAALNRVSLNSMRFMLEAAGLQAEGPVGAVKLQGLVVAWTRILDTWINDHDSGLAPTMAALDRELTRGASLVARLDDVHRMSAPLRGILRGALDAGRRFGDRRREPAPGRDETRQTEAT